MQKKTIIFLLFCFIPIFLYSQEISDGIIRVVMDNNYPPYSFVNKNGELQGILIDEWKEWENATGRKVKLLGLNWQDALQIMQEKKADVIDTIFLTDERLALYDFTKPYAVIDVPVFFHKSISGIGSLTDLRGFRVAVKKGDSCIDILKQNGITELEEYESYPEIIEAAKKLDIRVFCIDKPPALYYLYKAGIDADYRSTVNLSTGRFHRAVHKDRRALADGKDLLLVVQNGFSAISKEKYDLINEKWFGTKIAKDFDPSLFIFPLIIILVVLFILLSFMFILRTEIKRKTHMLSLKINELEKSEYKNKMFISALPDIFITLDSKGVYHECKTANPSLLMQKEEDLIGKNLAEAGMQADLSERILLFIKETLERNEVKIFEYELKVLSGKKHFEGRLVKLEDDLVLLIARDISERSKSEKELLSSLHEKEVLLREVHHRVKNNMQVISSLLALQSDSLKNDEDKMLLTETQGRIRAMAQIHELLFRSTDLSTINVHEYLDTLISEIRMSYTNSMQNVSVFLDVEDFDCTIDMAVPLGLIVNELVSNAFKFAFPNNRPGSITISLMQNEGQKILKVEDSGIGLPGDFDIRSQESLGIVLVNSLSMQLGGRLSLESDHGTKVKLYF